MYLLVGLGNPGRKYLNTRHNIGFEMLDVIAKGYKTKITKVKYKSLIGECEIAGEKVILAKPQTYMNLSGEAVNEIVSYYKIDPSHIIVIYDEAALGLGRLRIRAKGSAGGHNGIKNILYHLQTEDFVRVRVGIGAADGKPMMNHVLGNFSKLEVENLQKIAAKMPEIVETIIRFGPVEAMSRFNSIGNVAESET